MIKAVRNITCRLVVALLFIIMATADLNAVKWEKMSTSPAQETVMNISDEGGVEVRMLSESRLYVKVNRPTQVRVVTILGQPIAQDTLQPGAYTLKIPTKGIYIVKAGSITRRIVI